MTTMTTGQQITQAIIQSKKILEAIAECDRYIAKEEPRSADLRPAEVAKRLEFYKAHRAKLIGMLPDGSAKTALLSCTKL